jgi:hypothetical protein
MVQQLNEEAPDLISMRSGAKFFVATITYSTSFYAVADSPPTPPAPIR